MATKTKTKKAETPAVEDKAAETQDGPVLDLSDAAVKKMIKSAKKRGFVTTDELNAVLPSEQVSSEQIEDVMAMLSDMGINVVDEDEVEEEAEGGELVETTGKAVATTKKREPTDRTDDPVRMYLREMGTVELLSREGEIAIAKRIEAGRETMIAGLCENPLTFQALIIWRDELNEGNILLRDIIDLEATYAGPEAKQAPVVPVPAAETVAKPPEEEKKPEKQVDPLTGEVLEGQEDEDEDDDDDDMEASLSLAAMEAELKPQVFETLNSIASEYKKLRRLQDQLVEKALGNKKLSPAQEKRYKELHDSIVLSVKSLSLNNNRIEALIEQLYAINKNLLSLEGRLLRLAESYAIPREIFLEEYMGSELDPNWIRRIANLSSYGWKEFNKGENKQIKEIRGEIQALAGETGLQPS
ncbi:MAG: RNA polymerase sigma factor region1.1 domain-containing protein, partial [Pseudomonadota bacterium]